jgi:hypothetical protein
MKILIVTSNRCGSLALASWLQKELSAKDLSIPNDTQYSVIADAHNYNTFSEKDNCIVVLLYKDYKKIIEANNFLPEEQFDFTICLKRDASKAQSESYLWNIEHKKNKPYFITNEWLLKNKKELKKLELEFKKEFDEMSNIFGYHAVYESVFNETIPEDLWNISAYIGLSPKFYWTIQPTFKLRRFNKISLI